MTTPDANIEAITIVTGLLAILGRWVYAKATGKKEQDWTEQIKATLLEEIEDALNDGETLDTIESRLTAAIGKAVLFLGAKVPENTVRVVVQYGITEFRKRLRAKLANEKAARELPAKADELRVMAEQIAAKLATLSPDVAIDTIFEAKAAGVELLEVR